MSATTLDPRMHHHALLGAGWSFRSIAAHAHVAPADLARWVAGRDIPHVERGVLSINLNSIATKTTPAKPGVTSEPFVPRVGTVRRLQALMRIGWSASEINARLHALGVQDRRAAQNLVHAPGRFVTRSRHDAVARVYADLSRRPGPSVRSRNRAAERGYPSPAAWDDIDLDPAPAKPDHLCAAEGCLNQARWVHDYAPEYTTCHRHSKEGRS